MNVYGLTLGLILGLLLAGSLSAPAETVYWRSEASSGDWDSGQGCGEIGTPASPWWYNTWTPNNSRGRPDCWGVHQLEFGNNDWRTNTLNGGWFNVNQINFPSGANLPRLFTDNGINMTNSSAKIENNSAAHHLFNCQVAAYVAMQINPVSGPMTFNNSIWNNGFWIDVYGDNGNTLTLGGTLNQGGGLAVKQNSLVIFTNNNTFSGGIWVEKGVVRLGGHTNAVGEGPVNVGTNASLELNMGSNHKPVAARLYGTGTNSVGAMRKIGSGTDVWWGQIWLGQNARINADAGGLDFRNIMDLNTNTLYINTTVSMNMQAGASISNATKTTGDGALVKDGTSYFLLRPSSDLRGNILVNQGEFRIGANASGSGLVTGGTLFMNANTKLSSDGNTARTIYKNMMITGGVGLAINSSGGLTIHGNVDLGGGFRSVSNDNPVTLGGVISNGGYNKAGTNTLIMTNLNTYALGTLVSAGALQGDTKGLRGFITNNAQVYFNQAVNSTFTGLVSGTGFVDKQGVGILTLTNANTYSGGTRISAGWLSGDTLGLQGNITNNSALEFRQEFNGTYGGVLSATGLVVKQGGGTVTVSNNNTYSGATYVSNGVLRVSHANALGATSAGTTIANDGRLEVIGGITLAAEPLTLSGIGYYGGGPLDSVSGNNTVPGPITLTAHSRIRAQANTLTLNSASAISGGHDLTFQGGGTISVSSPIGTGVGKVYKIDAGTLILTGASTYSGGTTISNGTLIMHGTNTSTAVTVNSGAFLLGVGSVGGLTVSGTVGPGTNTIGIGKLDVTGLTMNDGSAFRVQLGDFSNTADRDYINNSGGAPTINATATIYVDSSLISNWDNSQTKSWNIIVGGVSSTSGFALDQATYWSDLTYPKGGGTFSLSASGDNLVLTFTAAAAEAPDIRILGTNGTLIVISNTTPTRVNGTDFGDVEVDGGTQIHTFTVTNSGTAPLFVDAVAISGTHSADFAVSAQLNVSSGNLLLNPSFETGTGQGGYLPDASVDNWVKWGAGWWASDSWKGAVHDGTYAIKRWDSGTGMFQDFSATAGGVYALSLWGFNDGAAPLADRRVDLRLEWYTAGNAIIGSVIVVDSLVDTDDQSTWIELSGIVTAPVSTAYGRFLITTEDDGASPAGEIYYDSASAVCKSMAAGSSTTFQVTFDPSAVGTRTATAIITNNVDGKSPYVFALQGTGITAQVAVRCDGAGITNTANPGFNYGTFSVTSAPVTKTFIITNAGTAALSVGNVTTSGSHAADFVVLSNPTSAVPPGGWTLFQVRFTPSDTGSRLATVSFTNSVSTNNPYTFTLLATVTALPDIRVLGTNGTLIVISNTAPTRVNGTDFGDVVVSGGTKLHTFTITNSGAGVLWVDRVAVGGAHAADFSVTVQPFNVIAENLIATNPSFEVGETAWNVSGNAALHQTFHGMSAYHGTNFMSAWWESVSSMDVPVTPGAMYALSSWVGTPASVETLEGGVYGLIKLEWRDKSSGDDYISATELTFSTSGAHSVTITPGVWTHVAVTGAAPANATHVRACWGTWQNGGGGQAVFDELVAYKVPTAGGGTTFQVLFDPSAAGTRTATVYITNNVTGKNPYPFVLQGTGVAVAVWDGGGANGNWDTAANWELDTVPAAADTVYFYSGIDSGTTIDLNGSRTVYGLRFNDSADSAITFTDDTLTINGGGIAASSGAAGNHVIASAVTLGANQSWTNESTTDITLSGAIDGAGDVTKMGNTDGRFVLSGNNTFSGTLTISQGRILITHANALGGTGAGTVLVGAANPGLQIQGGITTAAEPLTLAGDGYWGGGALDSVSGNNTFAGPITLSASTRIRSQANTLTLSSATAISGGGYSIQFQGGGTIVVNSGIATAGGGITKIDGGTLVLNGANTYSGATTLSAGTLIHNGTNTSSSVTVASGAALLGIGSVGALAVTGTVGPGTNTIGIGRLAVTNLTMNNGSSFRVQLGNNSDTSDRDYIQNSGGAPTINATATVQVDSSLVSNWDNTQTRSWTIIVGGVAATTGWAVDQTTYWTEGSFPKNGGSFSLSASGGNLVLTFTPLPDPSVVSATANGNELVQLNWTKHASYDVMIVHRAGSASTAPVQGTPYALGAACGSGTVIYKGSGAYLDHITTPGQTHHYAFYSYNGNYYSPGLATNAVLGSYGDNVSIEPFAYTNGVSLNSLNGGVGWSAGWGTDNGFTITNGSLISPPNYPTSAAHRAVAKDPGVNNGRYQKRNFALKTGGKVYFSYLFSIGQNGAGRYAGISLLSNGNARIFVGMRGATDTLGIEQEGGAVSENGDYVFSTGTDRVHAVMGYYDLSTREVKANAYYKTTEVPSVEPGTWNVSATMQANWANGVDGLSLTCGGYDGQTVGDVYYDEVRVATNWAALMGVTPTKPDAPASGTVTADGAEMVRLNWALNAASDNVMILHKTSAISTDPTDGSSYAVGATIDGATVIYKGSALKLEHVVAPGADAYYKFYSYNGFDYYSSAVAGNVSLVDYADTEKVNPFSYTNGATLGASQMGGKGFGANFWTTDSGTWTAQTNDLVATADTPRFVNMTNYPAMAGNLVKASNPGDGAAARAQRSLAEPATNGTLYIAFMMSYQFYGANKWAGISLFSNATEKAFLGKGGGGNWNTLAIGDGSASYWSAYDLMPYAGGGGNTGNVYLIVGKYDFDTKLLQAKAWRTLDFTFPETEPSSWDVSQTLSGNGIAYVDRIKLNVGATDVGDGTIGQVFFDEIRLASQWSELMLSTCPSWAGSNKLSSSWAYLGDSMNFEVQSFPVGLGQSASILLDFAKNNSWQTNVLAWMFNANNNSYWSNRVQVTQAGSITSKFVVAGSGCAAISTNNQPIVVSNIPPPAVVSVVKDAVNTNSQINLEWTRNSVPHDVLIVRRTSNVGWTEPTQGQTYSAGNLIGDGTVVYKGFGTTHNDSGLSPNTTYYYRFYSENWGYYSITYDEASAATDPGGKTIIIDGNPADWVGTAPVVKNSSAVSLNEFIWTDKKSEAREEANAANNADFSEFRVYADADYVYFLARLTNISDVAHPFIAVAADTRRSDSSTAMNWLADDSGTFIGSTYFGSGAALHFGEKQMNVHMVGGVSRIEMYTHDGSYWYGPPGAGQESALSATYGCVEWKVARADLNVTGNVTGRFTVAAYLNTGSWNNDGDGTAHLADNTCDAADSVSIPQWGSYDNALDLSAWQEDLSDNNVDFFFDVVLNANGTVANARPSTPALVTPTNNATTIANPNLVWSPSSDTDGQITGYFLEVSTNSTFNGVEGSENGPVILRVNLAAGTTNFQLSTTTSQYWWRVRSRDTAGELSEATTRTFRVVGKLDTEGPHPELIYIGTNVAGFLAGQYDDYISKYGYIQSVTDKEIQDTNNVFGFVIQWTDPSGVYATNKMKAADSPPNGAGGFAWNIVDLYGRVSPNWDLFETNTATGVTREWGYDTAFRASNTLASGNNNVSITNYVPRAFVITNYDENIRYYLTVSAEDAYSEGGSWAPYGTWTSFASSTNVHYSGWCEDGPNTMRNITTNFMLLISVTDDDKIPPTHSTNLAWSSSRSLSISNATAELPFTLTGLEAVFTATDGSFLGAPMTFTFNAYERFYKGIQLGTGPVVTNLGRVMTNTSMSMGFWLTNNNANYSAPRSVLTDTTEPDTRLVWHWDSITANDMTALWGDANLSGDSGVTNAVFLNLYDIDNDRPGDQASQSISFGGLLITDDDTEPPVAGNLLKNPGFEEQGVDANDALHWLRYEDSGRNDWARRNGDQGMAWWSWGAGRWGGFWQDVSVKVAVGQPVTFTIWGNAETGFVSTIGEAFIKLEFWAGGTMSYAVTNDVYAQLVGNYESWTQYRYTYTNTAADITTVKAIVGSGNWVGYDRAAVKWDDATLTLGSTPLRVFVDATDKTDYSSGVSVHTITDGDLSGLSTFRLMLEGYDLISGLNRGTTDAEAQTAIHVSNLTTNNVPQYYADNSSTNSRYAGSTNTWRWSGAFDGTAIQTLMDGGSNAVWITARDADLDRNGDQLILSNRLAGYLYVIDDDILRPRLGSTNNLLSNPSFETGQGVSIPDWNPYEHAYAVGRAAFAGTNGVEFTSPGWGNVWQGIAGTPSNFYTTAYYARKISPSLDFDIVYMKLEFHSVDLPGTNLIVAYETNILTSLTTDWQLFTFSAVAVEGTRQVRTSIGAGEWHGGTLVTTVQVDSVLLSESAYPLSIRIGSGAPAKFIATNNSALFTLVDGDLSAVNDTNLLQMSFQGFDNNGTGNSGLSRGNNAGGHETNMNVSVSYLSANNVTNYAPALSSADAATKGHQATSVWGFASVPTDTIQNWYSNGLNARVDATLRDADRDRANDQLSLSNRNYGFLSVIDDDMVGPIYHSFTMGGTPVNRTNLQAGDIAIIGYQSENNDRFSFAALVDIPGGTMINFTDRGWSNAPAYAFRSSEGSLTWTSPTGGIPSGVLVIFTNMTTASPLVSTGSVSKSGSWDLAASDSILSYQGTDADPRFLYGIIWGQNWSVGSFTTAGSELPVHLTNGVTAVSISVGGAANGYYGSPLDMFEFKQVILTNTSASITWTAGASAQVWPARSFLVANLSDGDASAGFSITGLVQDVYSGIYGTGAGVLAPTVTIYNASGAVVGGGYLTGAASGSGLGTWVNQEVSDLVISPITAGIVYTAQVVVADYDFDRTVLGANVDYQFSTQHISIIVFDNDVEPAKVSNLVVMVDGVVAPIHSGAGTSNVIYRVTDGDFLNAETTPISLSFEVYDTKSGIPRNTVGPHTNMNVAVEVLTTLNVSNYSEARSTLNSKIIGSTSVWAWVENMSPAAVSNLYGDDWVNGPASKANPTGAYRMVRANVPDADNDRPGDMHWRSNVQFGVVYVIDDDTNSPVFGQAPPGNLIRNADFEEGSVRDVYGARHWQHDDPDRSGGRWGSASWRGYGGYPPASPDTNIGTICGTWFNGEGEGGWWQDVPAMTGQTYEAGAWFWSDDGTFAAAFTANYCEVKIEFYNAGGTEIFAHTNVFDPPGEDWTWHSVTGMAPSSSARVRAVFTAMGVGGDGAMRVDDALLRTLSVTNLAMDISIGARSAYISMENSFYGLGDSTNAYFMLTDGDMARIRPDHPLTFRFNVYDPTSGVARSALTEDLNFDIGGISTLQNIYSSYASDYSSAETKSLSSTSLFVYANNFTVGGWHDGTSFIETGEVWKIMDAGTNRVTISAPNADEDRGTVDREWTIDWTGGHLVITDDDIEGPWATLLYVGSNYTGTAGINTMTDEEFLNRADFAFLLEDKSGIFVTNNSGVNTNVWGNFGNVNVNVDFRSPESVQLFENLLVTNVFSPSGNGSFAVTAVVVRANEMGITVDNNMTGTWAFTVSAQDMDNDRGTVSHNDCIVNLDRAVAIDRPMSFLVVDDDEASPALAGVRVVGTGGAMDEFDRLIFFDFGGEALDTNATYVADRLECGPMRLFTSGVPVSITDADGNPGRAAQGNAGYKNTNKYWSVSVVVDPGFTLMVTNLVLNYRSTGTGPDNWVMYHVAGGVTSAIASASMTTDSTWRTNNASVTMSAVTGSNEFRIAGGSAASGGGNWGIDNLAFLGRLQSQPGAGFVSDYDVANGLWTITGLVQDVYSGVYAVGEPLGPRYSIFTPEGNQLVTNKAFTTGPAVSGDGKTPAALSDAMPSLPYDGITLGTYTGYVYANDYDVDRIGDSLSITQSFVFTVVDDDDEWPRAGTIFQGMTAKSTVPHLHGAMVVFNGTNLVAAAGNRSNRTWYVTDRMMVNAATTNVDLHFNLYDLSGYYVSSTAGGSNLTVSIANLLTNNFDRFNADRSTANNVNNFAATNVWTFTNFSDAAMLALMETTSRVTVSATDTDNDRVNDRLAFTDKFMGNVLWRDNDARPSILQTHPSFGSNALHVTLGLTPGNTFSNLWVTNDTPGDSANQLYRISDGQLATVAATNQLIFRFHAYDIGDDNVLGLQRTNTFTTEENGRTLTNTHISVGVGIQSNATGYQVDWSSSIGSTRIAAQFPTSIWAFTSFTYAKVGEFLPSGTETTNPIILHALDADNDRNFDQAKTNILAGNLVVYDDDSVPPVVSSGVNLLLNPGFESGTGTTPDNWAIYGGASREEWVERSGDWGGVLQGWSSGGGIYQDYASTDVGVPYTFSAWGSIAPDWDVSHWEALVMYIEFRDASDVLIIRYTNNAFAGHPQGWNLYGVSGTSPENTAVVRAGWHFGAASSDAGSFAWDDALLVRSPPLRLYVGDEERYPVEGEGTNAVFEVMDHDLANLGVVNMLDDPGFEQGLSEYVHWGDLTNSGVAAETGTNGLAFASVSLADGGYFQDQPGLPGTNYTVKIRARKQANYNSRTILKVEFKDAGFGDVGGAVEQDLNPLLTSDWQTFEISATAPAGSVYVRAVLFAYDPVGGDDPKEAHFDNMVLKETSKQSLRLIFGAYDADSGLSRGTTDVASQMNIAIENMLAPNVAFYDEAASTPQAETRSASAFSAWTLNTEFSGTDINNLVAGGDNRVSATLFDADNDRPNDRMSDADKQFGFIRVIDNDTNAPVARDLRLKNGQQLTDGDMRFGLYSMSMYIEDFSGVNTDNSGDYWMPNYSLVTPAGKTVHTEVAWTYLGKLSGSNVWAVGRAAPGIAYEDVMTGYYAMAWSAQDLDADRPGDRMESIHSTNFLNSTGVFLVVDDDIIDPTTPSNIVLSPIYWTNVNNFVLNFDPATDASGIYEYRVDTNAVEPSAVTDGWRLPALYVTNTTGLGVSNHSFEVGSPELSIPGDPAEENGWRSFSSAGGYLWYADDAGAQDGVLASRHIINAGSLPDGSGRYTLCSQDVFLGNSNRLPPEVTFSGWFKGNLSHVGFAGIQGTAFLKAEGFDVESNRVWIVDNEWDNAHLAGVNSADWTQSVIVVSNATASTEFIRFSSGISSRGSRLALTGWWDNVVMTVGFVEIGGVIYTNAPNGITTNWFFAVDDDNDRLQDRLKGPNTNFVIMFDGVAPTQVVNFVAQPGEWDDTSEMDLQWSKLDNGGGVGSDPLSPWLTYKVYYTDDGTPPTTNSPFFAYEEYSPLGTAATERVTLSNLFFGVEYQVALAGVDVAGNEGLMSTSTPVLLSGFFVTQGVAEVDGTVGRADLAWTAATSGETVTREYDLLYTDAANFADTLSNRWKLVQRGFASRLSDTGDVASGRTPPLDLGNGMRFYRAAQKDRWTTNNTRRIASEEVYVLKTVSLYPGNNWVAFPGIPDTCTAANVFGHGLPAGASALSATRVSWFGRGQDSGKASTQRIFLAESPLQWQKDDNSPADDLIVPLSQGVVVYIPSNLPPQKMMFIGRVPTNTMTQPITGGTLQSPAYNLASFAVPITAHPSNMNLLESGFKGSSRPHTSDKLFKYDRANQQISGAGLWYKTNDATWRVATDPNGSIVTTPYFTADDGILIVSVNTNGWTWTNSIPYSAPTRYMSP